jgi:nanoRNase/pAp phosphatase (c-di-AMP/oligoRNAs hydrolase)
LILTHAGADPDALCAAFALRRLVHELLGAEAAIIAPEGISSASPEGLRALALTPSALEFEGCDLLMVVDTPSLSMLGRAGPLLPRSGIPIAQIDHHTPSSGMEGVAAIRLLDEDAPSTTEIAYSLLKGADVDVPPDLAQILMIGLVAESGRLSRLRGASLSNLCELSRRGGDIERALEILKRAVPLDERMARLRSAQRLSLARVDDILIAVSHVGSYHASAARALLSLGADFVATLSKGKGVLKITVRADEGFLSRTKIHVGRDICAPLGELLGGEGSGHEGVGGIRARGDISRVRSIVEGFLEDRTAEALRGRGG